jgi:phenylacetate-CoA ligase
MKLVDPYRIPLSLRLALVDRLIRRRARAPSEMARFAADQTRFYAQLYRGRDLEDFRSLPILHKHMVRDVDPFDLLARKHRDRVRYYGETTGSTGSPTPAFYTGAEFRSARVIALASPYLDRLRGLLVHNRTCVNGLAFGFTIAGMSFGDVLQAMGGLVANVGSRSTLATPPRIARGIARLRPSLIAATPIDFLCWMRILQEDHPERYDEIVASLHALLSTAELCAGSRVRRISEHFGIEHLDVYACVEGMFSMPCTCGEKHLLPAYHVELFDEQLGLIGEFGTGRLAFTNLVKESTPMLRYLLDDWATVTRSSCPHGFTRSVVPHGRYELNVTLPCGVVNVEQVEDCLFEHGLFGDYRAVLYDERIELTVERYTGEPVPVDDIAASFEARFGLPTRVEEVPFGQITDYRSPRSTKPILKLQDRRSCSTQEVPEFL